MTKSRSACLIAITLTLAACGGDGSLSGEEILPPPDPEPTKISGVWSGTTRDSSSGLTGDSPILIFTTSAGAMRIVALEFAIQASGLIDIDAIDDNFAGTADFAADLLAFAPLGFFFGDNTVTVSCLASATVVGKQTLSGTYECADSDANSGIFSAGYSVANDTLASAATLSGTWTAADQSLSITVDAEGDVVGTLQTPNLVSCNWTGSAAPIVGENLYNLSFTLAAENCGSFAGNYSGLGTVFEIAGGQDRLVFQADSGSVILANELFGNQ